MMHTPISYYGGKQQKVKEILPLIPPHNLYCEPFFGGGAVFFAKKPEKNEIINDINDNVINFYKVLKNNFDELYKLVDESLYSESEYRRAKEIHNNPHNYDNITRAWALWYLSRSTFASGITTGFSYSICNRAVRVKSFINRKAEFKILKSRMENVTIMSSDALEVIKKSDDKNTFFYIDPPYVNAEQAYYRGYTQADFNRLLDVLKNIKGKFLLSSYQNDTLDEYIKKYKWHDYTYIVLCQTGESKAKTKKHRIEQLTANYTLFGNFFFANKTFYKELLYDNI